MGSDSPSLGVTTSVLVRLRALPSADMVMLGANPRHFSRFSLVNFPVVSIGSASAQHGQKHSHSIGLNALNVLDLASRAFEQVAQLAGLLRVQRALAHLGEQRAAESLNRLADRLLADRRGGGRRRAARMRLRLFGRRAERGERRADPTNPIPAQSGSYCSGCPAPLQSPVAAACRRGSRPRQPRSPRAATARPWASDG